MNNNIAAPVKEAVTLIPGLQSSTDSLGAQVIACIADGIALFDDDCKCVLWNPAMERLTGVPPITALGRPISELFADGQKDTVTASLSQVFSGESVTLPNLPAPATTSEPAGFWEVRFSPWRQTDRGICGAMVQARSVSNRAPSTSGPGDADGRSATESELRVQAAALESAANSIVITDRQGRIAWVNPAFSRLTGYSPAEAIGQNPRVLKSGRHEPEFYRDMLRTISSGKVWQGEIINRRKNGTLYTEEMTITPVPNHAGEITHFIAIKTDVTERKEMETELEHSRQRFARIFQSSPAAIGICTVAEERLLDVNDNFLRLLGYEREEIIGLSAATLGLWGDEAQHARLMAQVRDEGAIANCEILLRSKLGPLLDALVSVERIQLGADPCLVFLILDITERKRLEQQLRQAQKMESLGTLAGGVAHDFNNLLTVMQGHANLALHAEKLPERTTESLRQITQASEQAANLTRQLLTFSRKQPAQLRLLNLNEVVGNLTKMLRRIIGEDITLECKYSPQIASIMADVGMMEQIVLNLAVNARDAMPEGGSLLISTRTGARGRSPSPAATRSPGRSVRPPGRARFRHGDGAGIVAAHL